MLVAAQSLRRAIDYAIARPGREILFTVVSREAKYKAKNVIETVVYRGGDALSGWMFSGLAALGIGFSGVALISAPLTAIWVALSLWLARRQDRLAQRTDPSAPPAEYPGLVQPPAIKSQ
jgi:AAA family ATP:ADP antiporter